MELMQLVILAIVVESVWETGKMVWQDDKVSIDRIGALILGLTVAIGYQIDLLATIGIPAQVDYIGVALTGVLISRGGNYIHDLLTALQEVGKEKIDILGQDDLSH